MTHCGKRQHKISHHRTHHKHKQQQCEQPFPVYVVTGLALINKQMLSTQPKQINPMKALTLTKYTNPFLIFMLGVKPIS